VPDSGAVELSIDTAGAVASVALTRAGSLLIELTWRTHSNHSVELLPAIDALLNRAGVQREEIGVVFVNRGPGSYAGLRVGISTAMGLALTLSADLIAVGRLEIDAFQHAAYPGPIVPVHQAGRGDLAWAAYEQCSDWQEVQPPRLGSVADLISACPEGSLICGETAGLQENLRGAAPLIRFSNPAGEVRRAATLAALGWRRYSAGERHNPLAVEPLYLREAHITQPKQAAPPA
jgi:tRNA threonylcarbamoyladenosine biosynthesis protein TsaB